jgi:pantoate--beta-alanine ligase
MRTLRTVPGLRTALKPARRADRTIALVPTMGALHEGHLSLIRAARAQADEVVVSLFVNPAQFNDPEDLAKYPRDEERDAQLAEQAGADILFAPPPEIVYPPGFGTEVRVGGPLTETLEGEHRGPEHFHGVTTVVTKLLNMVQPHTAFFGQKDAQQALVIRKLVRDLDMDVQIEIAPTVREPDGLALSSRNVRLHGDDRRRALALSRALQAAQSAAAAGERDATVIAQLARASMQELHVEPDYLALVNPDDLVPVHTVRDDTLVAVAARIGEVRLIDNTLIKQASRQASAASDSEPKGS